MTRRWHQEWFDSWHLEWYGSLPKSDFDGYGPAGVGTLVLDLENGYSVIHEWITDVHGMRSGKERRVSRNDVSRQRFEGSAVFPISKAREIRANLARFAAIGSQWLLALPHEALVLRADSSGTSVYVFADSLALCDWAKTGQRVVVARWDDEGQIDAVNAVVQSATADAIVLDVVPGTLGAYGGVIMPTVPVFIEPQQSFPRYQVNLEQWDIRARAAVFDFAPTLAKLDLGAKTVSAGFDGSFITSRRFGLIGNETRFSLASTGTGTGQLTESGGNVTFAYAPGVTTIGNLKTALDSSTLVQLTGSYTSTATIAAGDAFALTALSGAADTGEVGKGATLTTYSGDGTSRPVWDRRLAISGTITDSIHAMTQILDYGGKIGAIGTADQADWGRAVPLVAELGVDYQWFKLFLHTVKGPQKAFWLATWREDLVYVSYDGTSLTIDADDGDFSAWWPSQREHVQIEQADGTITYAKITSAVDNGTTRSLTLSVSLSASAVTMISWLELCRFNDGDMAVTFDQGVFVV